MAVYDANKNSVKIRLKVKGEEKYLHQPCRLQVPGTTERCTRGHSNSQLLQSYCQQTNVTMMRQHISGGYYYDLRDLAKEKSVFLLRMVLRARRYLSRVLGRLVGEGLSSRPGSKVAIRGLPR